MVRICSSLWAILKDYCKNSSLAGLRYVADNRYHYTERLFWLGCIILSWIGSINLIMNYMDSFYSNSVSMGVVSLRPADSVGFPSLGFCEMGYSREDYKGLEEVINSFKFDIGNGEMSEYNYDVEDFLMRVIFHNLYSFGSLTSHCMPYVDSPNSIKCPSSGYQGFADKARANCTTFFHECKWNEVRFDCCQYFKPVRTTLGTCFLLNSIQAVEKYGSNWLNMKVGMQYGNGHLEITVMKSSALHILNEEDIPHMLLSTLTFPQLPDGFESELLLSFQDTINDPSVRKIKPDLRKCIFPDEPSNSAYKHYSFSTCVTDCLKRAQIAMCNCTHFNLIVDDNDKSPECGFIGFSCLDNADLLFPQTTIMQPWRNDGLVCRCAPSCNEPQISVVGRTAGIKDASKKRTSHIRLQTIPSQRYFRQAVREDIDIVGELN